VILRIETIAALTCLALTGSAPARAEITVDDLQGRKLNSSAIYDVSVLRFGKVFHVQWTTEWTIQVGPGDAISGEFARAWLRNGTLMRRKSFPLRGVINRPHQVPERGGDAVWILDGDTLTLLRMFEGMAAKTKGGFKGSFTFSKTDEGLICELQAPFVREEGRGLIRFPSIDGDMLEVINVKQASSRCDLSK
jgi:hypothetical protein